jgi:hypothetical protein
VSLAWGVRSGWPIATLSRIFSWLRKANIEEIYYLNVQFPGKFSLTAQEE